MLDRYITVNNEIKQYEIGKIITFDDSYLHSVRNISMHHERVVLLIDIWHPYLTTSLIQELTTCFHNFTYNNKNTNDDYNDNDDNNDNNYSINRNYLSPPHDYDYTMKAIVIGNRWVGKSKFIMRACDDTFIDSYSFFMQNFKTSLLNVQNKRIRMRIWDYSSPERYHAMSSSYYRLANIIFVLFESTESIHTCSFWINEIKKYAPEHAIIIIVRSKMDLVSSTSASISSPSLSLSSPSTTVVAAAASVKSTTATTTITAVATTVVISQIELDKFFAIHGKLPYHEISSKTGQGVKSLLHSAAKLFLQKKNLIPDLELNVKETNMIDKKSYSYCILQ